MNVVQVYICHNKKDVEFAVKESGLPKHYSNHEKKYPYYAGTYLNDFGNISRVSTAASDRHHDKDWFKSIIDLANELDIYALFKMTKENK